MDTTNLLQPVTASELEEVEGGFFAELGLRAAEMVYEGVARAIDWLVSGGSA
jgi:hypothetical protein